MLNFIDYMCCNFNYPVMCTKYLQSLLMWIAGLSIGLLPRHLLHVLVRDNIPV